MAEVPFENPHKYGDWSDDVDELASGLAGRPINSKRNDQSGSSHSVGSESDEVDANVLRGLLKDSGRKYGTFD